LYRKNWGFPGRKPSTSRPAPAPPQNDASKSLPGSLSKARLGERSKPF
jgi:hypothetical protein